MFDVSPLFAASLQAFLLVVSQQACAVRLQAFVFVVSLHVLLRDCKLCCESASSWRESARSCACCDLRVFVESLRAFVSVASHQACCCESVRWCVCCESASCGCEAARFCGGCVAASFCCESVSFCVCCVTASFVVSLHVLWLCVCVM